MPPANAVSLLETAQKWDAAGMKQGWKWGGFGAKQRCLNARACKKGDWTKVDRIRRAGGTSQLEIANVDDVIQCRLMSWADISQRIMPLSLNEV